MGDGRNRKRDLWGVCVSRILMPALVLGNTGLSGSQTVATWLTHTPLTFVYALL